MSENLCDDCLYGVKTGECAVHKVLAHDGTCEAFKWDAMFNREINHYEPEPIHCKGCGAVIQVITSGVMKSDKNPDWHKPTDADSDDRWCVECAGCINPPVIVPCYKCGKDAAQIVDGWIAISEVSDRFRKIGWRRPEAKDFKIACWPCRQEAGELGIGLELQDIIVIPPGGYATPEQYSGLDIRLPGVSQGEVGLTYGVWRP